MPYNPALVVCLVNLNNSKFVCFKCLEDQVGLLLLDIQTDKVLTYIKNLVFAEIIPNSVNEFVLLKENQSNSMFLFNTNCFKY